MKQRLNIAQAIMEKPDFLFLDEPTNAIDREGIDIVRRIIVEEANMSSSPLNDYQSKKIYILQSDYLGYINGYFDT